MNVLNRYSIPYKGLSVGSHIFEFEVDSAFFKAFENSEIIGGNAHVRVDLAKGQSALRIFVEIDGFVIVECDRCLDEFELPVDYKGELNVKFSEEEIEFDGEVMWLNPGESVLNLAHYIYESINLSLPYKRVHQMNENGESLCNPEMLEKFKIVTEDEFDSLTTAKDDKMVENPQWDKLKELKEKMK